MARGKSQPQIPDGTTLQYMKGTVDHLCVDMKDFNTWSCYCLTSLPLNRGDEVVIYNRKTLISNKKFTARFNGQSMPIRLLEHNSGPPK